MGKKKVVSEDSEAGPDTVDDLVDNDGETDETESETEGTDGNGSPVAKLDPPLPPDNPLQDQVEADAPTVRSIAERIHDIEHRWGKSFEHVMLDLHDHIFGQSDPVPMAPPLPVEKTHD